MNECVRSESVGGSQQPVKPQKPTPSPPKEDPCAGCENCCNRGSDTPKPQRDPPDTPEPQRNPPNPPSGPQKPLLGQNLTPGPPQGPGGVVTTTTAGSCGCSTGSPCFSKDSLGIQYGKCYNLIDTNGLPLGREVNGVYQSGGDVGNLMFRVCKSTDDCSADAGTFVTPHTGKFFLQDQQGWVRTPNSWVTSTTGRC